MKRLVTILAFISALAATPVHAIDSCKTLLATNSNSAFRELPSERLKNLSAESRAFWEDYDRNFKHFSKLYIEEGIEVYREAKRKNHPHIRFLESLGFSFEPNVSVPDLMHVMDQIELRIRANIRKGKISGNDVLWPQMFISAVSHEGTSIWGHPIEPFGELPTGTRWREASRSKDVNLLLSDFDFAKLIVSGHMPVTGLQRSSISDPTVNELMHDLTHFDSMISHPDYMAAVKNGYRDLFHRLALKGDLETEFYSRTGPMSSFTRTKIFTALEGLEIINPSKRNDLESIFGLEPLLAENPNPTVEEIQHYYSSIWKVRDPILVRVQNNLDSMLEPIGGAVRDLHSYRDVLPLIMLFGKYKNEIREARTFGSHTTTMARFAKLALETKNFSAADWVKLLFEEDSASAPSWLKQFLKPELYTGRPF